MDGKRNHIGSAFERTNLVSRKTTKEAGMARRPDRSLIPLPLAEQTLSGSIEGGNAMKRFVFAIAVSLLFGTTVLLGGGGQCLAQSLEDTLAERWGKVKPSDLKAAAARLEAARAAAEAHAAAMDKNTRGVADTDGNRQGSVEDGKNE
jgi:CO dehydrogenase/acetyl-CoA synthase beta subunit